MQQAQSLAELRAQNEAEEKAQAEKTAAENSEAETEQETQEEERTTETNSDEEGGNSEEEGGEGGGESEGDDDAEEWLKPGKAVPVTKHVEMKHKLRGKIEAAEGETEKLRLENEQLKKALESRGSGSPAENQQELKIPKLSDDDIAYDEDKYQQRMVEYHEALIERKLSGQTKKQADTEAQQRFAQQLQGDVDKHYERAGKLVESGKITAENYQAADFNVRKAVAEAAGNDVTDFLIANLGDGSEKVIYHLGVNTSALSTLKDHLKNDPTGLRAATFLGSLQAKFSGAVTTNKLSNAPKPEKPLKGSQSVTGNQHLNAYKKAEKSDDVSGMLAAKRQAKAAGVDTSNW